MPNKFDECPQGARFLPTSAHARKLHQSKVLVWSIFDLQPVSLVTNFEARKHSSHLPIAAAIKQAPAVELLTASLIQCCTCSEAECLDFFRTDPDIPEISVHVLLLRVAVLVFQIFVLRGKHFQLNADVFRSAKHFSS